MSDFAAISSLAKKYEKQMVSFLREIVAIRSLSGEEGPVVERIRKEMESVGAFDRIWTDKFGNLFGQIGTGPRLIAIDAHVDTVGVGDPAEWKHDPFKGKVEKGVVYGRGAGDQKGATPAMVYAGKVIKELGLPPVAGAGNGTKSSGNGKSDYSLLLAFTVCEEDCDGLCWQYIVKEGKLRPECVIVTDSSNCKILRGQRGRMEIGVTVRGRSCHGSMPHKGDNAVYKVSRIIREIERMNANGVLKKDKFLGNGTITVTYVDCKTPSLCAVPDQAYIHLDRRLTTGETKELALKQVTAAAKKAGIKGADVEVRLLRYEKPTYTGMVYGTDSYFPTWCEDEDAPQVAAAVETYKSLFKKKPVVDRWTFSTNGVSIAGMFGIPCVGFGPAPEAVAHTVNDSVPIEHLVMCAGFYAAFPGVYAAGGDGGNKPGKSASGKRRRR